MLEVVGLSPELEKALERASPHRRPLSVGSASTKRAIRHSPRSSRVHPSGNPPFLMEIPACSERATPSDSSCPAYATAPSPPEFVYNFQNNGRLYPLQPYIS